MSRKVTVSITEVQYRQQTFEVIVPDDIDNDHICDYLCNTEYEIDENVEWESVDSYDEDQIMGIDSDRFDVYQNGKQVTGGHL